MSTKSKKILTVFIVIILISISIYVIFDIFTTKDTKADVPKWEISDTWIYNEYSHIEPANEIPNVVGMYVENITTYKNQKFYVLRDFTPEPQKNVQVDTLNPINNDGSLIIKKYDFPLKEGKEWEFKDVYGYKYKFKVVSIEEINVPAGKFETFKIDQQMFTEENSSIKFINKYGGIKYKPYYNHKVYYYSPDVKNNIKVEWYKDDDLELHIELTSYGKEKFKKFIDSEYIGGPYNSTIEHWQRRMPNYYENNFNKWQDFYYLKFNKNGIEYESYLPDRLLNFLDWLNNNSKSGEGVLCWWDYGPLINGYTDCISIIDSPSKEIEDTIAEPWKVPEWDSNEKIVDVSNALLEPPDFTIDILNKYNARYVLVDTSMFPFNSDNTGIFYAPVFAANKNYYDYITFDLSTNYGGMTAEEAESMVNEYSDFKIHWISMNHQEKFFDSMFYHTYTGWDGRDVGLPNDVIPGISDHDYNTPRIFYYPMQGWNLKNFKLVYRTAYWTPHNATELAELPENEKDWRPMSESEAIGRISELLSDGIDNDNNGMVDDRGEGGTWSPSYRGGGIFVLKYYDGAIINGIVRNSNGTPLQNVRVTVLDEYSIPHDSVLTDEKGYYNITTPAGELLLITSNGGWDDSKYSDSRIHQTEKNSLNSTKIIITEDQAMRLTQDWIIDDLELIVNETE
jgi:hypothetical protein